MPKKGKEEREKKKEKRKKKDRKTERQKDRKTENKKNQNQYANLMSTRVMHVFIRVGNHSRKSHNL